MEYRFKVCDKSKERAENCCSCFVETTKILRKRTDESKLERGS